MRYLAFAARLICFLVAVPVLAFICVLILVAGPELFFSSERRREVASVW